MKQAIKICGITTADAFECTRKAGATHAGFMFVEASPRFITPHAAAEIAPPGSGMLRVAVTSDQSDEALDAIETSFRPDLWQLHGRETPARIQDVKTRFGRPVMKAVTINGPEGIRLAHDYEDVADILMLDAAAGGSGKPFDWTLLPPGAWRKPWFLAGGLSPETVERAIYQTRPDGVDVSSGVESARGIKDIARIAAFIMHARQAFNAIAGT